MSEAEGKHLILLSTKMLTLADVWVAISSLRGEIIPAELRGLGSISHFNG